MSGLPSPTEPGQQSPSGTSPPGRRVPTSQSSRTTDVLHHNQGSSYFPPISGSGRSQGRSTIGGRSLAASTERDEDENDEDEDEDDGATERRGKSSALVGEGSPDDENDSEDSDRRAHEFTEDEPVTVKERQSLMNVDHPFGLPIWKPALYKKSRTINRDAETALHATPTAYGERYLHPGNMAWTILFGWWLSAVCTLVSAILFLVPFGGRRYAPLIYGLGWYLLWPFGKYVAGYQERRVDENGDSVSIRVSDAESRDTIHTVLEDEGGTPSQVQSPSGSGTNTQRNISFTSDVNANRIVDGRNERISFVHAGPKKSYGSISTGKHSTSDGAELTANDWLGRTVFWLLLSLIVAPLMLLVCLICWFLVMTVPMAKLNWELIKLMFRRPHTIRFCTAPPAVMVPSPEPPSSVQTPGGSTTAHGPKFTLKSTRLSTGQAAPSGTVLLCIYRAAGLRYYKYTVGGVNIFFVNLMAVVFFALVDGFVLLPMKDRYENDGRHVPAVLQLLASRALVFIVSLASVIPLSYFIGMAVASISAQSSIGMGAVINATFGSIIEIILYAIALTEGKGRLVEGSIVGSLLAGVLLMPGASMCSGAFRRKEQKFNAKSAGVTSTMLIMAIIGTLTPTMFYQTYGNFELVCDGCPSASGLGDYASKNIPWHCKHCYYRHPDPVKDDFYQNTVKPLMYLCSVILLFSYVVGLWFSLRTHASQIWQNPQPLMHPLDLSIPATQQGRLSFYHRLTQTGLGLPTHRLNRKASDVTIQEDQGRSTSQTTDHNYQASQLQSGPPSPSLTRRVSYAPQSSQQVESYAPFIESVSQAVKNSGPMQLPENMTTDDFSRAVAVATVSALRHQQAYSHSPARLRVSGMDGHEEGVHGGHDAPSWSRTTSASILLACTALYAAIAEILVDVVDVVLDGSGIDEKFLGLTLFALVPNTTEFMNAMSFAMYGNIALSMEIGSAYALQVCLLQIPAMVAFSVWHDPHGMGSVADTFPLIFPRWDVIAIVLSIFLLTYTYIEAKSNYHRGTILILSYLVLLAGFYFAPQVSDRVEVGQNAFSLNQTFSMPTLDRIYFSLSSLWIS